jgi:shikimate kinase
MERNARGKFRNGTQCHQPLHHAMPNDPQNIYLVGPMGSGKSTIGFRLANKMGLEFFDCDREIESRTGASVKLIFEIEGENGFRARESRMLEELSGKKGVLVATGGGAILSEENRTLLRRSGIVVYLRASVGQQLERLRRDHSRPLLQTENKESKLAEMAAARNPLYEEVADLVFPVKNRNIEGTVSQIHHAILDYCQQKAACQLPPGA